MVGVDGGAGFGVRVSTYFLLAGIVLCVGVFVVTFDIVGGYLGATFFGVRIVYARCKAHLGGGINH